MNQLSYKQVLCLLVLLNGAFASNANAITLPGIPPSGNPNFTNSAQVNLFSLGPTGFLMAATNAGATITFNNESYSAASTGDFLLTAQFSANGTYTANTGNLSIAGSTPYPGLPGVYISGDLLTAKLTSFNFDANTLGFSTSQTSGYGTLFGSDESVYLSSNGIAAALGFGSPSGLHATVSPFAANAITTVPVPAAVWLFGSAVAGLLSIGRRKPAVES